MPLDYNAITKGTQGAGKQYRQTSVVKWSHYNDPIQNGSSRVWGAASSDVQKQAIDAIIANARRFGLNDRETAHVLAIARVESGFNPYSAAGTTSASGLGQFIDKTGAAYGLKSGNRWDVDAQAAALVRHYIDNKRLAERRGQSEEYIYKYWHDGPTKDYGGLKLSMNKVMPLVDKKRTTW